MKIKWIIKVEIIILIIILAICLIVNFIPNKSKFIIKYNIGKFDKFKLTVNENYNYNDIENAVLLNNNINEEDKLFIKESLRKEINENIDYIDINKAINRLKKLKISYDYNHYSLDLNIQGSYNSFFNKMNLYSNTNKEALFHEINHLITSNTIDTYLGAIARSWNKENVKFNFIKSFEKSFKITNLNIFSELVNELFTREYMNAEEFECGYEDYMKYIYSLCEILPEDIIRKYKFYDNESLLISEILSIDDNIDEAYRLISSINSLAIGEYQNNNEKIKIYSSIHDSYAYFYEKKYNKKMEDDLVILLYFYNSEIQTIQEKEKIRSFLDMNENDEIISITPKGYVSEDYKESHKKLHVRYTKNGKECEIEINNN